MPFIFVDFEFCAKVQNKAIGQQKPCVKKKCLYLRLKNEQEMSAQQLEIEELIRKLGKEILPDHAKLMLFGSQARDDAQPDSDWDLLLLVDGERISNGDFDKWVFPFISLGWSLGVEINPVVYTYREWQQRQITPFYKNVMKEGIELC